MVMGSRRLRFDNCLSRSAEALRVVGDSVAGVILTFFHAQVVDGERPFD
jgi:hypothetical protein